MKRFLLGLVLLLSTTCPLFGQATNGFRRSAVALARASSGVTAQIVPNAKVTVTSTATGLAATIYSDPNLSSQITPSVVTADNSGNYGYYIPLGYMVTETITSPGQGTQIIPNIGNNNSGAGTSFQTNSVNNSSQTNLNFTDTATVKFTNPSGGVESAAVPNASNSSLGVVQCDGTTINCSGGVASTIPGSGLDMFINAPTTGTWLPIYPTGYTITGQQSYSTATASNTAGQIVDKGCPGLPTCAEPLNTIITWTFTIPSYINPSNVTGIYASAVSSTTNFAFGGGFYPSAYLTCFQSASTFTLFTGVAASTPQSQYNVHLTGVTGAQIPTITCQAEVSANDPVQGSITENVPAILLQVADSVDTPPTSGEVNVLTPLYYNPSTRILGIDPLASFQGLNVLSTTIAGLPTSPTQYATYRIRNGNTATDCTVGGGSNLVNCYWTGSAWVGSAVGGGVTSVSNSDGTLTISPTTGVVVASLALGHANTWTGKQTQPAPVFSDLTGSTQCLTVNSSGQVAGTGSACSAGSGFPITLGSTSIAASSTTTAVTGLSVNGVTLNATGAATLYLDKSGNYSTPSGSSGLSGMTSGQVGIAGSATTITSSKALAGSGSGITTGPTSSTSGDVAEFTGTSGQIADSGVLLSSLAPLASPTFTGVPAAPTAIGGTSTTQLASTAFVQAAIAAAGTGAGIVTYSGPSLTFTGTQYFPIGGGGLSSTTETNVDIDAPAAVTVQNMTVQMSAAPGVGNSIVYTWRKNASSTALTCTISGASATSCSDTTHNFTTVALDLLDIQTATTGTIVGTPTVVMAAQLGVSAVATVSSFSGDGALLSNSLSTGAVTATLANAAANTVWGNETGSSATPNYGKVALAAHATQAADTVVMNASGSTASPTAVAMPTCTSGSDLYNTSTHTWSCVAAGSSVAWVVDEMNYPFAATTGVITPVGIFGLLSSTVGSSAAVNAIQTCNATICAGRQGIVALLTGTAANGYSILQNLSNSCCAPVWLSSTSGTNKIAMEIYVKSIATGTFSIGYTGNLGAPNPGNLIAFSCDPADNSGSTDWFAYNTNGSYNHDTGVACTAWHQLEIVFSNLSVTYYIDNSSVGSSTAAALPQWGIFATAWNHSAVTGGEMDIDWIAMPSTALASTFQ